MSGDGYMLVFEGLDGSGKSELARRLTAALQALLGDERVRSTKEPHDAACAGDFLREVLAKRVAAAPQTIALAFAANRADHTDRFIRPFLDGKPQHLLVCDRYWLSSLAYQVTETLTLERIADYNAQARRPDLTLFLDVSADVAYERLGRRSADRELFDHQLAAVRQQYQRAMDFARARGDVILEIDADQTRDAVLRAVVAALNGRYGPGLTLDADAILALQAPTDG